MGGFVELTAVDGAKIPAYVAQPQGKARGAIVVLQEIFGINSHIRSVADRYAELGYLAVAPATFERIEPGVELGYNEEGFKKGFALKGAVESLPAPGILPDIEAAVAYGAELSGGKVGIVGYCWGGLLTWRAACNLSSISAAVCYYGGGMTSELEASRQKLCPVMAHFGRKDHFISVESVEIFEKAQPDVQVFLYDADHGFNCDQRGSYDATAAAQALERTKTFFAQHLG